MSTAMSIRTLGSSGLRVSLVCLDAMMFGAPAAEPEPDQVVEPPLTINVSPTKLLAA